MFLGKTTPGSQHDYSLFKQEFPPTKKWFKGLQVKLDSGYMGFKTVSYTHLRAHETVLDLVCRLLLEKKKEIPPFNLRS